MQTALWPRITKGDCFAKAHISTAPAPAFQNARLPRTHEDERRPQGAGGTPQEGTSSAHPRIARSAHRPAKGRRGPEIRFRARRGWCGAESLMLSTALENAAQALISLFSSAPTKSRRAGLDSASRKSSGAPWCATGFGGESGKSCAATAWRYPQDGTSSYIRRVQWRARRLRCSLRICYAW
jgi:hypothetical protein